MTAHANGSAVSASGAGGHGVWGVPERGLAHLVNLDSDLLGELTPEERQALAPVTVPTVRLSGHAPLAVSSLEAGGAFAAIVLNGMVFHHLQVGATPTLRILVPGDVLALAEHVSSELVIGSDWGAATNTTLALLGRETLMAVRHLPRLLVGLHERAAEQTGRVATQMAICQLPRVEDRLLAMFWLLAESFGTVTPSGTVLPLSLTHETLGALIGARRPTVSLALRTLAERGVALHRDEGWLLTERPAMPEVSRVAADEPGMLEPSAPGWRELAAPSRPSHVDLGLLSDAVERLRLQHLRNCDRVGERLRRTSEAIRQSAELRARIRRERELRTSRPPSS